MNEILDLMSTYRWPMTAGIVLVFTAFCLTGFVFHRRKYRSWLNPEYPWSTRFQGRVGLLGTWGYIVLMISVWVIFPILAAAEKETLRRWVAMAGAMAEQLAAR